MSGNIHDDNITFGDFSKVTDPSSLPSQPLFYVKPDDDFSPLSVSADTVFYLAITAPHIDKYEVFGPVPSFGDLADKIIEVASDSPPGLEKLASLAQVVDKHGNRVDNDAFTNNGFHKMVLEGQRSVYTVLEVITVKNAEVKALLPAPVFTVTRHGPLVYTSPLVNTFTGEGGNSNDGAAKGRAATGAFVGCFAEKNAALEAARSAMDKLVEGVEGVARTERTEVAGQGPKGAILIAMMPQMMWEVKVNSTDVFRQVVERAEAEGKTMRWRL